jgi:uncharacterized membrane protein YkvA (DUF1232 family)
MLKNVLMFIIAAISLIYLVNPTLGVFELLPDNLPGVGNIDEGLATLLLLNSARYFGIDLTTLFARDKEKALSDGQQKRLPR